MAGAIDGLVAADVPEGVTIRSVTHESDLSAVREIEIEAFGTSPDVVDRFIGPGMLADDRVQTLTAWLDGAAVGEATAYRTDDVVGVFGVGVVERARRRGIGAALTIAAACAFGDAADLAWLQPSSMAERLYERLGFRTVSRWEVWART